MKGNLNPLERIKVLERKLKLTEQVLLDFFGNKRDRISAVCYHNISQPSIKGYIDPDAKEEEADKPEEGDNQNKTK